MKFFLLIKILLLISFVNSEISLLSSSKETIACLTEIVNSDLAKELGSKLGKHLQKILPFAGPVGNAALLIINLIGIQQNDSDKMFEKLSVKFDKLDVNLDSLSDQVSQK